jgi:hypothetical protein
MRRLCLFVLLLTTFAFARNSRNKEHKDYVPDEQTAERIADAVLVGQYGEQHVAKQRPLQVDGTDKDYWIVQVRSHWDNGLPTRSGGGPAVWINKHSGCIQVMEHMK